MFFLYKVILFYLHYCQNCMSHSLNVLLSLSNNSFFMFSSYLQFQHTKTENLLFDLSSNHLNLEGCDSNIFVMKTKFGFQIGGAFVNNNFFISKVSKLFVPTSRAKCLENRPMLRSRGCTQNENSWRTKKKLLSISW